MKVKDTTPSKTGAHQCRLKLLGNKQSRHSPKNAIVRSFHSIGALIRPDPSICHDCHKSQVGSPYISQFSPQPGRFPRKRHDPLVATGASTAHSPLGPEKAVKHIRQPLQVLEDGKLLTPHKNSSQPNQTCLLPYKKFQPQLDTWTPAVITANDVGQRHPGRPNDRPHGALTMPERDVRSHGLQPNSDGLQPNSFYQGPRNHQTPCFP